MVDALYRVMLRVGPLFARDPCRWSARPGLRRLLYWHHFAAPERMTAGYCATMIVGFAHCTMGADFLAWARRFGGPRELGEIRSPVRLAFPQHDRILPRRHHAPQLLAAIPDPDVIELPRVGHVAMSDDPVAVAQSITDFTLVSKKFTQQQFHEKRSGCGLGVPHANW